MFGRDIWGLVYFFFYFYEYLGIFRIKKFFFLINVFDLKIMFLLLGFFLWKVLLDDDDDDDDLWGLFRLFKSIFRDSGMFVFNLRRYLYILFLN